MKAATYPDADHIAATNPMTNATPEAPRSRWMFSIALVRICFVVPGATVLRLWISRNTSGPPPDRSDDRR